MSPVRPKKASKTQIPIPSKASTRPRALTRLFDRLEPELKVLDFEAQEFACQACSAYERGGTPDFRREYKETRRWISRIVRDLGRLERQCQVLGENIQALPCDGTRSQSLPDEIREARKPRPSPISLLELAGVEGPLAYFRARSLPDPARPLEDFLQSLATAKSFLTNEIRFLRLEIPRVRPLWKQKPILWWQKGGFEYVMERLFRERGGLTLKEAHKSIGEIRRKLDGMKLTLDEERGYSSAIARAIDRMPLAYKTDCDEVLRAVLMLAAKS
jgi:hypothetical protein